MRAASPLSRTQLGAAALCAAATGVGAIHTHLLLAALRHRDTLILESGLLRAIAALEVLHALLALALALPLLLLLSLATDTASVRLARLGRPLPRASAIFLFVSTVGLASVLATTDNDFRRFPTDLPVTLSASRPNVLLIVADSLRRDLFDDRDRAAELMPHLSELRNASLDYQQLQAASSWTPPSVASLLTGKRPSELGAHAGRLPANSGSLAGHFRAAGYETVGITDNYLTHPVYGFAQGFESYWQKNNCILFSELWISHWRLSRWYERLVRGCRLQYRGAPVVNDRFMKWAHARDTERPFFAMLHYMDTHYPYYVYSEQPDNVSNASDPRDFISYSDAQHEGGINPKPPFARSSIPARKVEDLQLRYRGAAQYLDGFVGEILDWLRDEKLDGSTIVLFTADHGEEIFEHHYLAHGRALYGESIRVPLFLKTPAAEGAEPAEISIPVGMAQIAPTLLALTGLEASPAHTLPLPAEELRFAEAVFSELDRDGTQMLAGRFDRMKLIYSRVRSGRELLELYDLQVDPHELMNISDSTDKLPQEMLRQFSRACEDLLNRRAPGLTHDQIELLRGLGYLN
jgi:arylsulfatase A-like enzyme